MSKIARETERMADVTCKQCGNTIRIQGLGAICPHCRALVMASAPEPAEPQAPGAAFQPIDQTPIPGLPSEPAGPRFLPRDYAGPHRSYALYYIVGAVAAVMIIVIATAIILLTAGPPPAPVAVAPAPVPAAPTKAAEPSGSAWFSETPLPEPPAPNAGAPDPAQSIQPDPQPVEPPPATKPAGPPPPHAELARLQPIAMPVTSNQVSDEQIGNAIRRGVDFLLAQFSGTRLKGSDQVDGELFAGRNALAMYALLHAGQAIGDPNLGAQSEFVKGALDRLKDFPMERSVATYSRSLRISALGVLNRPEDRAAMEADLRWLLKASMKGAYSYEMPPPDRTRDQNSWDNSNSQYGALGVWAAAEAGLRVPNSYWNDVEQHWTATQTAGGGWGYGPGDNNARLAMSVAGASMLFVARDQLAMNSPPSNSYIPLTKAQIRALEWLDEGDNVLRVDGGHRGYTLYGLERAGLASGYKYFGKHDWYLHHAGQLVREQREDGSFHGGDGEVAETSFALLFLARGRHPVLFAKLRFDGNWNNRPRDLQVLTHFASRQLERPLNWQVADLARNWWGWSDAPVLMITSDRTVNLPESELDKLRSFALAGGLIFTHAERGSVEFERFAADLARKLFPEYPLQTVPEDHAIYSTVYPMTAPPPLKGVSNGARLLMVHSPTDLARWWQPFPPRTQRVSSELAINIAIYSSGLRDLRNRVTQSYLPEPSNPPIGTVPLARLKYSGNWNPEPYAWEQMSRVMQARTGIAIEVTETDLADLKYENAPIAHLTGTAAFDLSEADADALRVFVTQGGVLLIDACGGSKDFADFIQDRLLPKLFLDATPAPLPERHPLLAGDEEKGLKRMLPQRLRAGVLNVAPDVHSIVGGKGRILFTRLDLTNGLLGARTVGITGFAPDWSQEFVGNTILWTIQRIGAQ